MTPAYESDPEQPKIVPKEEWFAEPAQLSHRWAQQTVAQGKPNGNESAEKDLNLT